MSNNDSQNRKGAYACSILEAYGGLFQFFKSKYFWASLLITILMEGTWSQDGWWEIILNVSPDLIGFTLSAFAVILAFGNEKFQEILRSPHREGHPILIQLSGTFSIFIILQVISLLSALLMKSFWVADTPNFLRCVQPVLHEYRRFFWFLPFLVFVYSTTLAIATVNWIFLLAEQFVRLHILNSKGPKQ